MGERVMVVPVCDRDGRDATTLRKFAWQEDHDGSYVVELGADPGAHDCYGELMTALAPLRDVAKRLDDQISVVAAIVTSGDLDPAIIDVTAGETSDAPEETAHPTYREMNREERTLFREWWKSSAKAKRTFGPPNVRGVARPEVVAAYYAEMTRRKQPARERVRS